jgi:hypothetical protein
MIAKPTAAALLLLVMLERSPDDYLASSHLTKQAPHILARNALRSEALGCYELLDSLRHNASESMQGVPALIRLDSTVDAMRGTVPSTTSLRMLGAAGAGKPVYRDPISREMHPRWSADSLTDTVRLFFTNGFSGAFFALNLPVKSHSDTLKGRADSFIDVGPPFERSLGDAWAIRRACPD